MADETLFARPDTLSYYNLHKLTQTYGFSQCFTMGHLVKKLGKNEENLIRDMTLKGQIFATFLTQKNTKKIILPVK